MKKLTIAEKKQKKQTETKEKEKKEVNKQRITQRVKVNVNVPGSYSQPQSKNFPNSFYNTEQTTLLKSINEQLKQKNAPISTAPQTFNIPIQSQPTSGIIESQPQSPPEPTPPTTSGIVEDNSYELLPPQFSEKISPPPIPIIKPKPAEQIPIVSKPPEQSAMTLIQQLKQKQEERKQQEEKTPEDVEIMEEEIKEERTNPKYKRLTEEEKKQKAEEKRIINQEKERIQEIEQRIKINEAENKKQIERERGFIELLNNTDIAEHKKLQEAYETGLLTDKAIKDKLKKLKYTPQQIKNIFSGEKNLYTFLGGSETPP